MGWKINIHGLLGLPYDLVFFMAGIEAIPACYMLIGFFCLWVNPADIVYPAKVSFLIYPETDAFDWAVIDTITDLELTHIDQVRVYIIVVFYFL